MEPRIRTGTVVKLDPDRGIAFLSLDGGGECSIRIASVYQARGYVLSVGDVLDVEVVRSGDGELYARAARGTGGSNIIRSPKEITGKDGERPKASSLRAEVLELPCGVTVIITGPGGKELTVAVAEDMTEARVTLVRDGKALAARLLHLFPREGE